ncbi:SusD/RagB family nutrient-binding outer membrane lipoprotein [Tenacibaculum sp. UWU-22]|uniref:SusD/RagB family nutrient-binding outer membrane lipoprotein n=1 Tax=Tenacibaculum sp. UWU-22 TaxID=3234187 RepID=UPI0034DB2229
MKFYKTILGLVFSTVFILTACDTDLDINKDPDLLNPNQIPMNSELPTAITGIAASSGSYYALAGGFWSQFWSQSAVANQYKSLDDYSLNGSSSIVEGGWSSMYDALTDIRNIKKNALAENNWNFYLAATTLEVYASQILVDFFGTIPYSEANNPEILNPKFQSGEDVYDIMVADLKGALSKDLSTSEGSLIGSGDLLFSGDMDNWVKFANTLLLKLYMRQSKARPVVAQDGITTLINSGAKFLDVDVAVTQFVDEDSKSNPLYETDRRQLNVGTNLRASRTLGSFLQNNNDTRLSDFYDGTTFQNQGDYDDGSATASVVILSPTSPVYLLSAAESYFLQAEADVRYFGGTNAKSFYDMGVTAAFNQWGKSVDATGFLTTVYAYPGGTDEDNINAIITQKWIASFPGNGYESFIEQNRTGYPKISSVSQTDPTYVPGEFAYSVEGKTGGKFPKRFEYPQTERQRNTNAPNEIIKITEPVWYAK